MYKLIVTTRGNSYCVFGETLDKKDYPTIELGSTVFIPELNKMLLVIDTEAFVDVTGEELNETPENTTPPAEDTPPTTDGGEGEDDTTGDEPPVVEEPAEGEDTEPTDPDLGNQTEEQ